MSDNLVEVVQECVNHLEKALSLEKGFFTKLLHEPNDWAFLIQLQVILEASLTHVIVQKLNKAEMFDHVSKLNLQGKTGKLQLAASLEVIDRTEKRSIELVAEIRNQFAHRLENIGSSLVTYASQMDENKKWDFLSTCMHYSNDERNTLVQDGFPKFGERFKLFIWFAIGSVLGSLSNKSLNMTLEQIQAQAERWNMATHGLSSDNSDNSLVGLWLVPPRTPDPA